MESLNAIISRATDVDQILILFMLRGYPNISIFSLTNKTLVRGEGGVHIQIDNVFN